MKNTRFTIGRDQMHGFAGLSDGDLFATMDGRIWKVSNSTYGITLRNPDKLSESLEGFRDIPDYGTFIRAVNEAVQ